MKITRLLSVLGLLLMFAFLISCDSADPVVNPPDDEALSIEITVPPADECVEPETTVTLTARVRNAAGNATIGWSVDNSDAVIPVDAPSTTTVTLSEIGTYVFTVTAEDEGGGDPVTDTRTITVAEDCGLSVEIDSPHGGSVFGKDEDVFFSPSVSGGMGPYTFSWDFGAGPSIPTSTEQYPTVTYTTEGSYTVTVTVTDANGLTITASVAIEIADIQSTQMPLTAVQTIVPSPPNFGGSDTPDGGALILANTAGGAAVFDTGTDTFGEDLLPGTRFFGGAGVMPTVGPQAIVGYDFYEVFVSRYNEANGSFDPPTTLLPTGISELQLIDPALGNLILAMGPEVKILEINPSTGDYEESVSISTAQFPGINGSIVSAVGRPGGNAFLACSAGSPSQLYFHDGGGDNGGILIGDLGNQSRKLRGEGEIYVAIDLDGDLCSVFTWDPSNNVSITDSFDTGRSPRGCDVMLLDNGNYGCVVAGRNDNSYTVAEISPAGLVLTSTINDAPVDCGSPDDAMWARDGSTNVLLPSLSSSKLFRLPSGL